MALRYTTGSLSCYLRRSVSNGLTYSVLMWHRRHNTTDSVTDDTTKQHSGLKLTDKCVQRLLEVSEGGKKMLRVTVDGGGCSGFMYKFNLDSSTKNDDKIFERDGARVIIDELSLGFLDGSTVDYHEELIRSSFRIEDIPQAEKGCSCGASFAVK
ncbi:iron-sulfur cluster assembly 2 homolog, mitochondrial-like isoform X2 [Dysidea avara]